MSDKKKSRDIYLTFAESPSGVFLGQVIDVCKTFETEFGVSLKLVSFVSVRNFGKTKKNIRSSYPNSWVFPMFPKGIVFWYLNVPLLLMVCWLMKCRTIFCRNAYATLMALKVKKMGGASKVIYDGRGAYAAEWKEYLGTHHQKLLNTIENHEKQVVNQSDFRLAVSDKLVEHWKTFGYTDTKHVVVPCTMSHQFLQVLPTQEQRNRKRQAMDFKPNDVVLLYAGSTAGWQSFSLMQNFLTQQFESNPCVKALFLSNESSELTTLKNSFPGKVFVRWCKPEEVPEYMSVADYGILIRENTVTNQVAAPVKFAEYLACGLKVIISDCIGDYPVFVKQQHCGIIFSETEIYNLQSVEQNERETMYGLAMKYFNKKSEIIKEKYALLANEIMQKQ